MKSWKLIYLFVLCTFLFFGCGKEVKDKQDVSHASPSIGLDNGEKWLVNAEMKPYVEAGRNLVNDYLTEGREDYQTLATELDQQNQSLIKSCTMEGKSHEELHKWLHPHLQLTEELAKAGSKEAADQIVLELKTSYDLYDNYFR